MISKSAIVEFLARPLRDSAKAKQFSDEALDEKLARMVPRPTFYTKPRRHQKITFLLCAQYGSYVSMLDMGTGKTKVALDLISWLIKAQRASRALVLVPNTSNVVGWSEEVLVHAPHLTIAALDSTVSGPEREEELFDEENQVVVVTYQGLLALLCESVESKKDPSKNRWLPDPKKITRLVKSFQIIIPDESTHLKNPQSLLFKTLRKIATKIPYRLPMTGTPMGKNPADLWSQFFFADLGDTLGETLGLFRGAFYEEKRAYWHGGMEYTFRKEMEEDLRRMLRHGSIRFAEEECQDLPEVVRIRRDVVFPSETWAYYDRLLLDLKAAKGNFRLTENAWHNMRTLSSGFLGVKDPEGEKVQVTFKKNPKLDTMMEDLLAIRPDRKVVIFNEYIKSGDVICEALRVAKISHVRIYSGTKGKEDKLRRFMHDPVCRVLVGNHQSIAKGLNLQMANYVMFYESPTSPIDRKQAEKRCHRGGQERRVFIIDYVVKKSIDAKILKALEEGKDLFTAVIDGREDLSETER